MILKVKQNENPYDVIGNYIEKHISVIDNIIAVISINGKICNELFLVEISSTSNFVWQTDWWEGEENVELIDFFFVSDACKEDDNNDLISRQAAIDTVVFECGEWTGLASEISKQLRQLPSAQPESIRINLNKPIKVKLTDWGKEIYYHQYDRTNQITGREICKPKFPKEDENGYTEFQLWHFMELYGEHIGMTLPNVIEPLEIVYERRTG